MFSRSSSCSRLHLQPAFATYIFSFSFSSSSPPPLLLIMSGRKLMMLNPQPLNRPPERERERERKKVIFFISIGEKGIRKEGGKNYIRMWEIAWCLRRSACQSWRNVLLICVHNYFSTYIIACVWCQNVCLIGG